MPQATFEHLMQALGEDPWRALELSRAQHHSSRRREWELATIAYAFALWLREQPGELARFYDQPFFSEGYRPNPKHLLLHVLQFQRDDRHGEDGDRAQVHAAALQGAYDAGWTAEQVLAALVAHGGFAPLRRWFAQQYEDADGSVDVLAVEDDRRQLGLTPLPAATRQGKSADGGDAARDDDWPDSDDADGEGDGAGEATDGDEPAAGAAGAAGPRSQKYADSIDGLNPLEVLSNDALFRCAMELEGDEFVDIRIRCVSNGDRRYRRIEGMRLR